MREQIECWRAVARTDTCCSVVALTRAAVSFASNRPWCVSVCVCARARLRAPSLSSSSKCSARRVLHEGMRCARKIDGRLAGTAANEVMMIMTMIR